ncbi:hypothetical protein EON82_19080 [bacterium]|nr:MAG: hypothetical protein EON82_19080 [bacterium]
MMPLSLLAALVLQDPAPLRDLRAGPERRYRVRVEIEGRESFTYRLGLKIVGGKLAAKSAEPRLEIKLTDYRANVEGREAKTAKLGGGVLGLPTAGLPEGIDISGPQGPFWLPLLSLYLPDGPEDGDSPIVKNVIGPNLRLEGKATFARKDGKGSVALDASIFREGRPLGKFATTTSLDRDGWPRKAEGTLVSADGTYRFTLERG